MSSHTSVKLHSPKVTTHSSGPTPAKNRSGPASIEVSLRWGDVDSYGHVNNCEIVRIIEEARMRWLMSTGAFEGEAAVVAAHEIGYLRPLEYSLEPVSVEVWTSNIRRSSFEFNFMILDNARQVSVKAVSRMVMFDLERQESYLIRPPLRKYLDDFCGDRL